MQRRLLPDRFRPDEVNQANIAAPFRDTLAREFDCGGLPQVIEFPATRLNQ
jgi:hypothetical protein